MSIKHRLGRCSLGEGVVAVRLRLDGWSKLVGRCTLVRGLVGHRWQVDGINWWLQERTFLAGEGAGKTRAYVPHDVHIQRLYGLEEVVVL
jgi:hypothetical protein